MDLRPDLRKERGGMVHDVLMRSDQRRREADPDQDQARECSVLRPSQREDSERHRNARRGVETSERLGRHRLVVERILAWLNRFRRLTIRHERRADIHQAFVTLGCVLICLNQISRFC